jgi:ParB-like chromosome segregation protein Spo0J
MNLRTENISIRHLLSDPKNARKHSKRNIEAIKASLKQFGQRKPIIVTKDNVIVAGNGTIEAAKELGWTDIEIVRTPEEWSKEETQAFALADNRTAELAEWNEEVLSAQLLELQESGLNVEQLGFEVSPVADFDPVSEEENPPLDERVQHECPYCTGLFEMKNGKATAIE